MGCQTKLIISEHGYYQLSTDFPKIESPKGNELTALRIQLERKRFTIPFNLETTQFLVRIATSKNLPLQIACLLVLE